MRYVRLEELGLPPAFQISNELLAQTTCRSNLEVGREKIARGFSTRMLVG